MPRLFREDVTSDAKTNALPRRLPVVGQRQFVLSLRYGHVLDKAAMMQLLTGEEQPPPAPEGER